MQEYVLATLDRVGVHSLMMIFLCFGSFCGYFSGARSKLDRILRHDVTFSKLLVVGSDTRLVPARYIP